MDCHRDRKRRVAATAVFRPDRENALPRGHGMHMERRRIKFTANRFWLRPVPNSNSFICADDGILEVTISPRQMSGYN